MQQSDRRRDNRGGPAPSRAHVEGTAGPSTAGADMGAAATHDAVEPNILPKYSLTKANVRAVRKQAGASRWAICLGKLLEHMIEEPAADADVAMGDVYGTVGPEVARFEPMELAAELWEIVPRTEDGVQELLRDRYRAAKEKRKKKELKAHKREKKASKSGKGRRSYSSSEMSSSSCGSSSQ